MKKFVMMAISALFVFTAGYTMATEPRQDAVLVGRHLNQHPVVLYNIRMGVEVFLDGENQSSEINAWMEPNGNIIKVLINDAVILDENDAPVQTLPRPASGEIGHTWVNVSGYDSAGKIICDGFSYAYSPDPGHRFDISMWVADDNTLLKVNPPNGVPAEDTYMSINGYGRYYYDGEAGGYRVYMDPTKIGQTYAIWHNGQIVSSGVIDVNGDPLIPGTDQEAFSMSLSMPADVEVVNLTGNQYDITYKGLTAEEGETSMVSGEVEKAKVFSMLRDQNSMFSGLSARISGLDRVKVTVFAVDGFGQLVKIDELVLECEEYWAEIQFSLYTEQYQNLILVYTDLVYRDLWDKTFDVVFSWGKG